VESCSRSVAIRRPGRSMRLRPVAIATAGLQGGGELVESEWLADHGRDARQLPAWTPFRGGDDHHPRQQLRSALGNGTEQVRAVLGGEPEIDDRAIEVVRLDQLERRRTIT